MWNKWQKIETAPKDSTRVILTEGCRVFVGCWDFSSKKFKKDSTRGFVNPTNWMPLPEPPEGKK